MTEPKSVQATEDWGVVLQSVPSKNKKEIVDALASYHDIDFTGCLEDNDERSIYEYLEQFKTTQEKLEYLLQYGEWEIQKTNKKGE